MLPLLPCRPRSEFKSPRLLSLQRGFRKGRGGPGGGHFFANWLVPHFGEICADRLPPREVALPEPHPPGFLVCF